MNDTDYNSKSNATQQGNVTNQTRREENGKNHSAVTIMVDSSS